MLYACFLSALVTSLATGLGALPFAFMKAPSQYLLGVCNCIAAGMMVGASLTLLWEGLEHDRSTARPILLGGALVGWLVMDFLRKRLPEDVSILELKGVDAKQALLVFGVMFLHSFAEGLSIGVSFGDSHRLGRAVSSSLAIHNIPEGFAISVVLVEKGVSLWKAGLISIASSLPQPAMALPALLFVQVFRPLLPIGLGFAAGAMGLVTIRELLPEAYSMVPSIPATVIVAGSAVGMLAAHQAELL